MLIEQSLTSIPADVSSGVDRSLVAVLERDSAIFDTIISPEGVLTKDTPALRDHIGNLMRTHNESVNLRREAMTTKSLEQTIPQESIERAIAAQLERSESLKALAEVPAKLDKIAADAEAEAQRNMEYRAKLDKNPIWRQPGTSAFQLEPGQRSPARHG